MSKYSFRDIVIDSRTGLNPRKNFKLGSGNNYYITIKDIHNGKIEISDKTGHIDDDAISIIKKRSRIKNGDILFTSIGRIGETAIVSNKNDTWEVNESIFIFTINREIIDAEYFCILLQSPVLQNRLTKDSSGSTFKSIKMNQLEKLVFDIPCIEEQIRITTNIKTVTNLIELCNAILEKMDLLVKTRFVEMFGEPVYNTKKFKTKTGRNIFKLSNGKAVPEERRMETGIPAYGGNGIYCFTDKVLYNNDTLVIGRVGFQSGNVHFAKSPLWITDNAMYISELLDKEYNLEFLFALMKHIDFTRFQDAGDLKKITQKPFMSMEYIAPPLELQQKFADFVEQVDKSKLVVKQVLEQAETLKKALIQEYFG